MSDTHRPDTGHERIVARLSAWLDDDLEGEERTEVSVHLRRCTGCRSVLADLERIRREARALPPREPARELWPGIRSAIGRSVPEHRWGHEPGSTTAPRAPAASAGAQDGVSIAGGRGQARATAAAPVRSGHRGLFLTLHQLAAAALVVLAVGVSGGWWLAPSASAGPPPPVAAATDGAAVRVALPEEARELEAEAEDLRVDLQERSGALEGRTARTVADNLAVIDRAIREAEDAYRLSPESAYLERHVVESHRRRVSYLREAVDVTSWSADG